MKYDEKHSVKINEGIWNKSYDWEMEGEEWSENYGDSETQWYSDLYPRIRCFLPSQNRETDLSKDATILEIAPGHGRWTRFLLGECDNYIGVDISEKCVEHCNQKFKKGKFYCNDGISLDVVPDNSIDFCFSFDSLVHANRKVLESYIPQIIRKLTPNGIAFIHHSNLAACKSIDFGSAVWRSFLAMRKLVDYKNGGWSQFLSACKMVHYKKDGWRAADVSGNIVCQIIKENAGKVIVQENINWNARYDPLIDSLTCFTKNVEGNIYAENPKIINNNNFELHRKLVKDTIYNYSSKNIFR